MLKISVVTPSFRQAQFLERTIRSVLDQNYPNLELFVVDGGSTDGSVEIIKKYAERITWWVSEKDNGHGHALNKGFTRCTGDILCWLNSDDTFLPGALHKVAEAAEKNPDCNFFFGDIQFIDPDDKVLGVKRFAPIRKSNVLLEGMVFSQPGTFWRKSLMDKVGLVNESVRFLMDYDLFCRMAPHAKYKYINAYVATYRLHDQSKTCTISSVGDQDLIDLQKQYRDPVYPAGFGRKTHVVALKAERVLYHLSRLRLGYLTRAVTQRLGITKPVT